MLYWILFLITRDATGFMIQVQAIFFNRGIFRLSAITALYGRETASVQQSWTMVRNWDVMIISGLLTYRVLGVIFAPVAVILEKAI